MRAGHAGFVKRECLARLRLPQATTTCRNPPGRCLFADNGIKQNHGEEEKTLTGGRSIAPGAFERKILDVLLKPFDQVNEAAVDQEYVILVVEIEKLSLAPFQTQFCRHVAARHARAAAKTCPGRIELQRVGH